MSQLKVSNLQMSNLKVSNWKNVKIESIHFLKRQIWKYPIEKMQN
jgi:hypothetical protein